MSLSRTPSPQPGGGWALSSSQINAGRGGSSKSYGQLNWGVTWESAQARSARVHGFSSYASADKGYFRKQVRKWSESLPRFNRPQGRDFSDREKLRGGRLRVPHNLLMMLWRQVYNLRRPLSILLSFVLLVTIFYVTPLHFHFRRALYLGGGQQFVIILGANEGGGVMEWKGPREWAIERDSVRNKRKYAHKWGYDLEIVDMATKKRYAHEWRESWEKVDEIRKAMREYPYAEWFWWLDLTTFIMEPSYSLQSHIFNELGKNTYRDINLYNPMNVTHPPTQSYLDEVSLSKSGDGDPNSINLILTQDCAGFNLGSFFVRRSAWTDRLLDIWWDPVHYEQKHMQWEHKEQDALEYIYQSQPWIRSHVAFLPQRKANSFPTGACGADNPNIHYHEKDRDFMVSMAGCGWGRDCWGEMYHFRELSNRLNRSYWEKFKDSISDCINSILREVGLKKQVKKEVKQEQKKEEGTVTQEGEKKAA